jgi:D-beta-D-heptose 7-phosphate kinase/D-beta-D-heptose 1-phosphate adenosyltransferase
MMTAELTSIVQKATGKKVLLVGDLILDRYIYGDAERISPEAPVPVLRVVDRTEGLGGSASVAGCLIALGVLPVVCGVVGEDAMGRRLRKLLSAMGADCAGVVASVDRPTTTKTRLVGLAQHRHRQQLMRVDEESTEPLSAADRAQLCAVATQVAEQVDAICIEDYEKGVVTAELVATLLAAARKAGKPVLVDPGRLTDYSRYRGATLLTPNRNELALAVGRESVSHEDIASDAETLRQAIAVDAIVVTLDREGALIVAEGTPWRHVPTRPRSVYDNTGAGDAVLAMLATALVGGAALIDAVRLANIAGGLEVEKFGCVPITAEEVLAELRLEDRHRSGKRRSAVELVNELALRRDRGETVVFTNGCFDILHAGHIDFLTRCAEEGSVLVVAINSDASVRALGKGSERPINREADRATLLAALSCVDYVTIFPETDPRELIERIRPDILVKGDDWAERGVVGREIVESYGGRVKVLPLLDGYSTTHLVERIITTTNRIPAP